MFLVSAANKIFWKPQFGSIFPFVSWYSSFLEQLLQGIVNHWQRVAWVRNWWTYNVHQRYKPNILPSHCFRSRENKKLGKNLKIAKIKTNKSYPEPRPRVPVKLKVSGLKISDCLESITFKNFEGNIPLQHK